MSLRSLVSNRIGDLGWSQGELSQRSDIDVATLSRLLNGKQELDKSKANRLATTLNLPVESILIEDGWDLRGCKEYAASLNFAAWLKIKYGPSDADRIARIIEPMLEVAIDADRERGYLRPAIAEVVE